MKKLFQLLFILSSCLSLAQTKLIAHRSHSGSDISFKNALENKLFDGDNFGLGRMEIQEVTNLDSIVYLSNDKVIAFSSNYTQRYRLIKPAKCIKPELTKIVADTVTIKPKVFKKGLTIAEVRAKFDTLKNYNNDLSEVKYKDFDEKTKRLKNRKRSSFFPIIPNYPNIPNSFFLIMILGFISILVYLLTCKAQLKKLATIY